MLSSGEILESIQNCPHGYLKPDHILFSASNSNLLKKYKKLGAISSKEGGTSTFSLHNSNTVFCNEFGCNEIFDNVSAYQSHYNVNHRFICGECKRSFPTGHFLDLHLLERHDSYFLTRIERGERLFKCYLTECNYKFGSIYERKEHCIKQHKFPNNFRFDQTNFKSIHKQRDILPEIKLKEEKQALKLDNSKSKQMRGISFGHQKERTFCCSKRKDSGKTLENMNTLKQAIELL